jgi:hypothetical protein
MHCKERVMTESDDQLGIGHGSGQGKRTGAELMQKMAKEEPFGLTRGRQDMIE